MYFYLFIFLDCSKAAQFHTDNSDHLLRQIYAVPFGSQVKRSEVNDSSCHSAARAKTESVNLGKDAFDDSAQNSKSFLKTACSNLIGRFLFPV